MLLEAKNVSYRYGSEPWLFQNFNFSVSSGEIVGLLGPSGCGKSTFAKVLSGFEKSPEGSVLCNGKPLNKAGYQPVQLVFQHPEKAVNPRWQMRKVISEAFEPNQDLLKSFGIENEWLKRWPNELSGGELQRFCVVRALAPETKFIIADEMTTMLDAITQAQIWHAFLEVVQKRKLGVVVISHDQHLLEKICTRIVNFY